MAILGMLQFCMQIRRFSALILQNSRDWMIESFECAVDDYLESCKERGVVPAKPYSGKLVLRMSSELHGQVAAAAVAVGTTINDFINQAVSKEVARIAR